MSKSNQAVIVFIKNPELGKVKTRLAKTIGDQKALEIYNALTDYTRKVLLEVDCDRFVFYDQDILIDDDWGADLFHKRTQHPGNLGDRMQDAFSSLLKHHEKVLIIGSDCPHLMPKHIQQAFASLDQTDLVFGPSLDGGYYLLGMKSMQNYVFEDIPWSTASVYGNSLTKVLARGHTLSELEHLTDIDYEDDLKLVDWL